MNIFAVDASPILAAQALPNHLVVKMVSESVQILSTVAYLHGRHKTWMWAPTHEHHPCVVWAASSPVHTRWLCHHAVCLGLEHGVRYPRSEDHDALELAQKFWIENPIARGAFEPWAQAMPDVFQRDGGKTMKLDWTYSSLGACPVIDAYRDYVVADKSMVKRKFKDGVRLVPSEWTNRPKPDWWRSPAPAKAATLKSNPVAAVPMFDDLEEATW